MFSPSTDHYALPSRDELYFSSAVPTQIMTILALPALLFIFFLLNISVPIFFYVFPLFYLLFIPLAWYSFAYKKSDKPLTDTELESIVSRAESRLGMSRKINLYRCDKKINFIASARTPFIHGIMVSDNARKLIKEKPVEGEIVLANELALFKRDHLWLSFIRNLAAILYSLLTEGMMLIAFIEPLLPVLYSIPLWIFAVILCYPLGIGIFIWYRRKSSAENEVESIYGMNPNLALFYVFSRRKMSDAGRRHYINEIESNIESRKARTAFVSLGLVFVISLFISAILYVLFISISMPFDFALFGALVLGGVSFSFGVYHFESTGTQRLKHLELSKTDLQHSTDELTITVEKLLSIKTGMHDCRIYHYPFDFELDYEGEETDITEVQIGDERMIIMREEWNVLSDPELISSYLVGGFIERKAGVPLKTYSLALFSVIILLVSGTIYLAVVHMSNIITFILWIFFWIGIAMTLLFGLNFITNRRRAKALTIFSKSDDNYKRALDRLIEDKAISPYIQVDARRRLRKIGSIPKHIQ